MTKFYLKQILLSSLIFIFCTSSLYAQQVPNPGFEDWSGEKYDGKIQPKDWYASHVTQAGFKFNLTHRESGHSGSYSMMVQDTEVGAMGITETSPGYFSLGRPWTYLEGLEVSGATAGTSGGITFKYRPDTMSVWIKRIGDNVDKEDFYLLYYAWSGTAKSSKYKGKNGNCTSVNQTNEESDIRLALDANECGTDQAANQIAEGMWREKKAYGNWTNIRVPIYYFSDDVPSMMNIIFSASNYPNYRANSGLYVGNSLYIDDVELIYSSKIQKLYINGREWKGFNPNSTDEQLYSLGRNATSLPKIDAVRGAGSLSNARGEKASFQGRKLSSSEISIKDGAIDGAPTTITVKSEDGKSTTTYKIKFVREASSNAKLANILVNGESISNFQATKYSYNHSLPYGTTTVPEVTAEKQEDDQTVEITQAASLTGTATIKVTAADGKTTNTYTISFSVAQLSDNTLKDIKVNGASIAGFNPNQTIYRVSLPTSTTTIPTVEAISAYPAGAQTITHTTPTDPAKLDGGQHIINVTTPGNPTPKTYKLTYKLEESSYALLKDLQMGDGLITNFDPNQFTYYVNLPIGTTTLPEITYELGEATQQVTVQPGGLNGVSKVIVVAGNGVDQNEYKIVVSTAQSSISTLNMIYLDGVALTGFDPSITAYTETLPVGTTVLPSITYEQGDEYQTVTVTPGGVNGITRITVKAQDGSTTVYQITFSVGKATNATLKMIYLDGKPLTGFDPSILDYNCPLPQGTTELPVITYEQGDPYQTITVRSGGINGDYRITVRPQSGASQTYTLHFSVATSDNADLKMIYLDGVPLAGFDPDVLSYVDSLPMGVNKIPNVTYEQGDASQKVFSLLSGNIHILTVTAESGKTKTYTITFIIQRSTSAYLKMIYLNGDSLKGFDPQTFSYTETLVGDTCPKIEVDKEEGQQITIIAPRAAGTAQINVKPEGGAANIYTIDFVSDITSNTALLDNIYVDGDSLPGFQPAVFNYSLSYTDTIPVVTYNSKPEQHVEVFRNKNVITLYVRTDSDKAQYTITFNKVDDTDTSLRAIYIDNQPLAGFDSAIKHYTVAVPAGQTIPSVSFDKQNEQQTTLAGLIDATHYGILVTAANGDTCQYVITFDKQLYSDATLLDIKVEGMEINYAPNTLEYSLQIAKGQALPRVSVLSREGQHVSQNIVSPTEQNIIVTAENGNQNIYKIFYTYTSDNNAFLIDILLNGESLSNFHKDTTHYVKMLDWRTRVVPCVQPVGTTEQIITTYHSAINGRTHIHVESLDRLAKRDYYIDFPVRKSSNVALEYIDMDVPFTFDAETTDYTIALPVGRTEAPIVSYGGQEPEQDIQYIARPLGQTSQLIVTAEDGSQRTYNLTFLATPSQATNVLKSLRIAELDTELDPTQTEHTVVLPYGATTMTVAYEKNFTEQSVWVAPGGVKQPTKITVKSNRAKEKDLVYTITPVVSTQNPAVLDSILVDSLLVTDFDKNRFSYIQNRSTHKTPQVVTKQANGVIVNSTCDTKSWKATVSKDGYTNTYIVYFHYTNDTIPNGEFTQWTKTSETETDKPSQWNAPGDYVNKRGDAVQKSGNSVLRLFTEYDGGLMGAMPAVVNIGKMYANTTVAGGSSIVPYSFIPFHNTPDQATINYNYKDKAGNGALVNFIFYDITGTEHSYSFKQTNTTSGYTETGYTETTLPLSTDSISSIIGLDIVVDATGMYPDAPTLGSDCSSDLYVDYIRFVYNSTLKGINVGKKAATKGANNTFTHIVDTDLLPQLQFIGEVSDQAQKIVWSEAVEMGYNVRTAMITNFAEDGTSTNYTLKLKRQLDSNSDLKGIVIDGDTLSNFDSNTKDYTIQIASNRTSLLDIQPVLVNKYQRTTITYNEKTATYTIRVTSENPGAVKNYTIKTTSKLSDDTELENISAEGITFDPKVRNYTITASQMPMITFVKKMDSQTVDLKNGVLTVTAENGDTASYTIHLEKPAISSTGALKMISIDDLDLQGFSSTTYEYTINQRPTAVGFTRSVDSDSVIVEQTPNYLNLKVCYGEGEETNYRINFATSMMSDDATLHAIMVNGKMIDGFDSKTIEYTYYTDSATHIETTMHERAQKLTVHTAFTDSCVTYQYTVMAEDGTIGNTYQLAIKPNLSHLPYLQKIYLDGEELPHFHPEVTQYVITLPTGASKQQEPALPSIDYLTSAPRQMVEIELGKLGETTNLIVHSEDKTMTNTYQLLIQAEPSHNAELNGIIINGKAIENFEPGRHYYSVQIDEANVDLQWGSDDNFQTVTLSNDGDTYYVHVQAQDKVTTSTYEVVIYRQAESDDATLANVLLDGLSIQKFYPTLNPQLEFSPMQQRYNIYLPAGTSVPEISAVLNTPGQTVELNLNGLTTEVVVTAPNGVTTNTYTFAFHIPMSSNTQLDMIYINGDSLASFLPSQYHYFIDLPVGDTIVPSILAIPQEASQIITDSLTAPMQHTIYVTAEDGTQGQYLLAFNPTYSDADTLLAIFADGDTIPMFSPDSFYYSYTLPVGTDVLPALSWIEADKWQTVDTISPVATATERITQINVTAGSGKKNTYTVSYTIEQSSIDTLQMIFVNGDSLIGFNAQIIDYQINLTDSLAPSVTWMEGDMFQTVIPTTTPYLFNGEQIGWKTTLQVLAQNGGIRTYSLYFYFTRPISTNADLAMIYVAGEPLTEFAPSRYKYTYMLAEGAKQPAVGYAAGDAYQTITQEQSGDTTTIVVTAEDSLYTATYTVIFQYEQSPYSYLEEILLDGSLLEGFRPDSFYYDIHLPYGTETLPELTYTLGHALQTVSQETFQAGQTTTVRFTVTAADMISSSQYDVRMIIALNPEARLKDLLVKGQTIAGFHADTLNYTIEYPIGTDSAKLLTLQDIQAITLDSAATYSITQDDCNFIIQVDAADGVHALTYTVRQVILRSSNARLAAILLDGDSIRNFDPNVLEYTHYITTTYPLIEAIPEDSNAVVTPGILEGDSINIYVTAADGTENTYTLYFPMSTLQSAQTPSANDVLLKHMGGLDFAVASLRKNVSIAVYSLDGQVIFTSKITESSQNDAVISIKADGSEQLMDIHNATTYFTLPEANKIFFYAFIENEERRIASGKLVVAQ